MQILLHQCSSVVECRFQVEQLQRTPRLICGNRNKEECVKAYKKKGFMKAEFSHSSQTTTDGAIGIDMLLGLWILFSPFLLGFRHLLPAAWNNVGAGILIAVFSGIRVSVGYSQTGWSWCAAFIGLWLIISPFLLSFANTTAMWNNIIVGAVVALLSWMGAEADKPRRGIRSQT